MGGRSKLHGRVSMTLSQENGSSLDGMWSKYTFFYIRECNVLDFGGQFFFLFDGVFFFNLFSMLLLCVT